MNVLIIGLRAAGKSTIGRALALRRSMSFVDLDDRTLQSLGARTVADAWRRSGQAAFRLAESRALIEALRSSDQVIALGGGSPTAPGAADAIQQARLAGRARVVYLRCDPVALRARLAGLGGADANRPSITGVHPHDEIEALFAQRDPLYRTLADLVVDPGADVDGVADAVERSLWPDS